MADTTTYSEVNIPEIKGLQNAFFEAEGTADVNQRIDKLKQLKQLVESKEKQIAEALRRDFQKPEFETYITETSFILSELKFFIKNLKEWTRPERVKSSLLNFPSKDFIYPTPYGVCLVLAPWNYPFQLTLSPAIGAIAAGNTVVLKPSEYTPHTSALIKEMFERVFPPEWVTVVQGGVDISQQLLEEKWNYVFFTGSVPVGRIVAKAIAENLTPATLELGGKSPCIVHSSAKIQLAAKRIAWGKFINAGQTCIAPDYILVDAAIKEEFIEALKQAIMSLYGTDPIASPDLSRIINKKHFERLTNLMQGQKCLFGGQSDEESLYIAPSLIDEPDLASKVMQEEIFGPLLPILSYTLEADIEKIIRNYPRPLSLYVFSEEEAFAEKIIQKYHFGGGVVNDVLVHIANKNMPFGGVGDSGYGAYHGKFSFDTFTHKKSISKRATWIDIPLRYPPYGGKLKAAKKFLKFL
ncbi:MAG: aldehyde dehydrogenase [Salinimicrobium sp.]